MLSERTIPQTLENAEMNEADIESIKISLLSIKEMSHVISRI